MAESFTQGEWLTRDVTKPNELVLRMPNQTDHELKGSITPNVPTTVIVPGLGTYHLQPGETLHAISKWEEKLDPKKIVWSVSIESEAAPTVTIE